jgi:hypothetical protein
MRSFARFASYTGFALAVFAPSLFALEAKADPSGAERALAEALFRQAKELMTEGRIAEACSKFGESQRLDPGGGTLLNLAVCHEREGKLATAWGEFKEALAHARKEGRADRIELAEAHIAALEPQLPELALNVPEDTCQGELRILIDGYALRKPAWGAPMPVDPGNHVIEANCSDTSARVQTWSKNVQVSVKDRARIDVPRFERVAEAAPPAVTTSATPTPTEPALVEHTEDPGKRQRLAGYVALGAGVVGLGLGGYFGLKAIDQRSESDDKCPRDVCTDEGLELNEDARRNARLSNISLGIGLVSTVVGAWLVLSAEGPVTTKRKAALLPFSVEAFATPHGGMCSVTRNF